MSNQKKSLTAIRGMNDILPQEIATWQFVEHQLRRLADSYGYSEVRLPIIEKTELFKRSVGEVTDIVEKEMYTFLDRNSDSLTLRPEGTAGVVRAGIEHSLFYGEKPKVWYLGPMYRHERPQKGRYRQFYQFGLEAFGYEEAYLDAEILAFSARLWQELGLDHKIELQINSLGTYECREKYKKDLVAYFKNHYAELDADSQRRLETNPLRILDSKNPDLKNLISEAPKLFDYLDDYSKNHFDVLCKSLDQLKIKYTVNPYLVRGLDYYCLTVFEWVTAELGAQGTVCAGGRYDGLVEQIGGNSTPAVGFSMGMERIVLMLQEANEIKYEHLDCIIILTGEAAFSHSMVFAEKLRDELPELKLLVNYAQQSFKAQMKKADKSGAKFAIIIGEDEINNKCYTVKYLRERQEQKQLSFNDLVLFLKDNTD